MPNSDTMLASGDYSDCAFSEDGTKIYAVIGNQVQVIQVSTGAVLNSYTFGNSLSAIDLSADGGHLVVVDRSPDNGHGSYYLIDLSDNSVSGFEIPTLGPFFDVEFVANDSPIWPNGYLALMEESTGRLFIVEPYTGNYSFGYQYGTETPFTGSADGSYFAIAPSGITWPLYSLDVSDGSGSVYYGQPDPYAGASVPSPIRGLAAVSPDGTFTVFGTTLQVLNGSLSPMFSLADAYPYLRGPIGMTFSPDGSKLLILDRSNQLVVFDTSTWAVVGAYGISGTTLPDATTFAGEILQVSNDGRYVSIIGADGLHLVDTSTAVMAVTDGADQISGVGRLFGFGGNDVLTGGEGEAWLYGGEGNDTYNVSNVDHHVVEVANQGVDLVKSSISFSLDANIENLILVGSDAIDGYGNSSANVITGNNADNLLQGEGGNDWLKGMGGADLLNGGTGNDILDGGDGVDTAYYAFTASSVVVDLSTGIAGPSSIYNDGTGTDTLVSIENVVGTYGNDGLYGDSGANLLDGFDGNDIIDGRDGNDTLKGGNGNDVLRGGNGNDVIDGGAGRDRATYALAFSGVTVHLDVAGYQNTGEGSDKLVSIEDVEGSNYADALFGDAGSNSLFGLDGNDFIDGGGGADELVGGLGNDIYVVDNVGDVVTELSGQGTDEVRSRVSFTLSANVENLTLMDSGNLNGTGNNLANRITGNSDNNVLTGLAGDDYLFGGAGNDTLDGGAGLDRMYGGVGDDTYIVSDATDYAYENVGEGYDRVLSAISLTLRANVEELVLSGTGTLYGKGNELDNVITGNAWSNKLYGLDGNDTLYGGLGNDQLTGGNGADQLYGGVGNDFYYITDANDTVHENVGEGTDRVYASIDYVLDTNVEYLILTGTANLTGSGNAAANSVYGNDGDNWLYGLGGDDRLYGADGNDHLDGGVGGFDRMWGGYGDDVYYIHDATDYAYEFADQGHDLVYSDVSQNLRLYVEDLVLTGTADNYAKGNVGDNGLTGNSGANKLYGLAGNDTLDGGAGNDWLEGGAGQDLVTGGSGADDFVFRDGDFAGMTAGTADRILDFSQAEGDRIRLNIVDANTTLGGDQAFSFIGTTAFHGIAGELRYEQLGGNTYVMGDTNGDGNADFWIRLDGLHTLGTGDFVF